MYGIVNQAIRDLVVDQFGLDKWEKIREVSGVTHDFFVSNEPYEDNITFELVGATSDVLGISTENVLEAFGEYWVLKTGLEKYGDLMKAGGENFREFLLNLPNFHSRIMLIYPKLSPPEFMVHEKSDDILELHYYSERHGLTAFVIGLIKGIAQMYNTTMSIELVESVSGTPWHDTFEIEIHKG
jgi:hypothetical protein